jgi:hypothetical protein
MDIQNLPCLKRDSISFFPSSEIFDCPFVATSGNEIRRSAVHWSRAHTKNKQIVLC